MGEGRGVPHLGVIEIHRLSFADDGLQKTVLFILSRGDHPLDGAIQVLLMAISHLRAGEAIEAASVLLKLTSAAYAGGYCDASGSCCKQVYM